MWKRVQLNDGELILRNGEPVDHIYAVIKGSVRVLETTGDAKLLSKGSIFGEHCLVRSTSSNVSVYAEGEALLSTIHKDHFLQSFETNPKAARKVVKALLKRIREKDQLNSESEHMSEQTKEEPKETDTFDPNTTHGRIMQMTARSSKEERPTLTGISSRAKGELNGGELVVEQFPFHICRKPSTPGPLALMRNYLLLDDDEPYQVSQNHCRLINDGRRVIIVDDKSRFGTFIDGETIGRKFSKQQLELSPGKHRIALGNSKHALYQFEIDIPDIY